ncbi:MAG TPA: thiamine-binding protein [Sediminibacterium sp.]|nr:thiamine-binding protein [Sediminibacterium sp.]
MHNYLINASLQMLPLARDRHPYAWVDEVIAVIQASGLAYEIGPFTTIVEGSYEAVIQVINTINEHLVANACPEWILQVQLQLRSDGDMTGSEKTAKYT